MNSLNIKEKKDKKQPKDIVKNTFEYPSISITEDLTGWKGGYNQLFGRQLNKKSSKNSKNKKLPLAKEGLNKKTKKKEMAGHMKEAHNSNETVIPQVL